MRTLLYSQNGSFRISIIQQERRGWILSSGEFANGGPVVVESGIVTFGLRTEEVRPHTEGGPQALANRKVPMYAVIATGGKQYRVSPGDVIEIEKLPWEVGVELELNSVVAVSREPGEVLTGAELSNAKVTATIVAQDRGDKVRVFKFKRKKQYRRTIGHRQDLTRVKVTGIVA